MSLSEKNELDEVDMSNLTNKNWIITTIDYVDNVFYFTHIQMLDHVAEIIYGF